MDTRRDLVIALCVAALGAGILWMTGSIRMGIARDVIGPRAFPYAIGTLLLVGGLVLSLRRLRFMNAGGGFVAPEEGSEDTPDYPASAGRVLFIMVLSVAYVALLMPVGYLIWTVLTYLLFSQLLDVRMPVGPLTPLFRDLGLILL
jgi:putative tricarboxylic transport membrane protein